GPRPGRPRPVSRSTYTCTHASCAEGLSAVAPVHDAPNFADRTLQGVRIDDLDLGGHAHAVLDVLLQFGHRSGTAFRRAVRACLHPHGHVVHAALPGEHQLEVRCHAGGLQHDLLDLRRVDVHPAQHDHVVAAPGDLAHPAHRAGGAGQQPGEVPGAVADDRHGLFGQRGEHEFPLAAVRQRLPGDRIDDLGVEVVLPDVQAVLGLHALAGHPGAHHFGQPVDVHGVDVEALLDLGAHLIGPGFGAEDADLQRSAAGIDALALELVEQRQHVGRGDHDDLGLEVLDDLHLTRGHAAGGGNDGATQLLGSVVGPEATGEQPVPVGDVHLVPGAATGRADRAGHHFGPGLQITVGVTHHGGFAGGAAGGVQPADLLLRNGEHAERVVLPQVLLGGE